MSAAVAAGVGARIVASALQLVTVAVGAPLVVGLVDKVRARAEGRVGAPVAQPLADLRKLVAKERIRGAHSSGVLVAAPLVLVASVAVAAVIVPLVTTRPALGGSADSFVLVALFLMGSVGLALAGLDTGTGFGGMGASRAVTIGALAEPALLVALLALSLPSGSSNLPAIVRATLAHPVQAASPGHLLAVAALALVVVAETGRLPVDNPATHLELTMVHEAMVLEYAGPDLALVNLGSAMRLGVLLAVVANVSLPWGIAAGDGAAALLVGTAVLVAKVAVLAVVLAVVEVSTAKLRLFRVPELLAGSFVLAVLAVVTGLVVS